ncbi:MAG: RAMP superfamily CRISPR-associated protein [Aphanizomenon gracile PMC644.10]|nr:RAMP superfamily CRISPR-associated protein [Aphanizomenon gracile PMC644.10]
MSDELQLKIKLLSDTTFGRGDGVAGLIDQEVEHDDRGFPYLRGRTLKGLLSEECDNLIVLLKDDIQKHWLDVRNKLFGVPGSVLETMSIMHVGDACLPHKLTQVVSIQMQKEKYQQNKLTPTDILNSLTTIRRQTAINPESGSSDKGSLRSARVLIRDRPNTQARFTANLFFDQELTEDMKSLLVVGVLALRHLGSGRNRGRGHVQCSLYDVQKNNLTQDTDLLNRFGTITGDK